MRNCIHNTCNLRQVDGCTAPDAIEDVLTPIRLAKEHTGEYHDLKLVDDGDQFFHLGGGRSIGVHGFNAPPQWHNADDLHVQ